MSKLYSIGELLIDFQSVGTGGLKDTEQFVKKAGGAPANVCAQASKLGVETCYLTKVGDDGFGEFLIDSLGRLGVDTTFIQKDKERNTSLAFVSLREDGEREFSFYRTEAADLAFVPEDFAKVNFHKGDILEFGSVALGSASARATHDFLIEKAKKAGALVAFDPNLRFNLWKDKEELKAIVRRYIPDADIIKMGEDELEFITSLPLEKGVAFVLDSGCKALLLTRGAKGASLYLRQGHYDCPGYKVRAIDATGAGDSFFGAFLALLLRQGNAERDIDTPSPTYQAMLEFACKAGAYTTTNYGAIPAMGDLNSIERTVK